MMHMTGDELDSTTADISDSARGPISMWVTRAGRLLLIAVVVLAAIGFLGPRPGTTSASANGWEFNATFPVVLRAGQPAPIVFDVSREGGFDGPISLSICGDYFSELDFQNWYPNPSGETRGSDSLVYEFDPPEADRLTISLDARAAPGGLGSISGCTVSVLEQGQPAASLNFTTWRLP